MKFFSQICISSILAICFSACGSDGESANNGFVKSDVKKDVGIVDTGESDSGSEDTGGDADLDASSDAGSAKTWPKPGTYEYWLSVIPGIWEQRDPETGLYKCKSEDPNDCKTEIFFTPIEDKMRPYCLGAEYTIEGKFFGPDYSCIYPDGTLELCSEHVSPEVDPSLYTYHEIGNITEKIIVQGKCSDSGISCSNNYDCSMIDQSSACQNLQIEYWLETCVWETGFEEDKEKNTFHYLKVE